MQNPTPPKCSVKRCISSLGIEPWSAGQRPAGTTVPLVEPANNCFLPNTYPVPFLTHCQIDLYLPMVTATKQPRVVHQGLFLHGLVRVELFSTNRKRGRELTEPARACPPGNPRQKTLASQVLWSLQPHCQPCMFDYQYLTTTELCFSICSSGTNGTPLKR